MCNGDVAINLTLADYPPMLAGPLFSVNPQPPIVRREPVLLFERFSRSGMQVFTMTS